MPDHARSKHGRSDDATSDDANRWRGHPALAAGLRLSIVAVPLAAGYGASVLATHLLMARIHRDRWWLLVALAISVGVCIGLERLTRRLLPLAALLKLSMLFPDKAPNRFRLARGKASTTVLNARMAGSRDRSAAEVAEAVLRLITALTAHDRRTRGHSERVRVFVELLGEQLRLPRDARDRLRWASLLHDVGKLSVAPEILNKPAKLSDSEFRLVAEHPTNGEQMLGPLVDWLGEWGSAVRQHHEKFDGSGYPDGLAGPQISRAARIVAICDSYEVMTAHRAYKKPMATVAARAELARCAGSHFDPTFVRAFLSISLPKLLWAMGPGALLMNIPMLRLLATTTPKALAVAPQSAAAAALVVGGLAVAPSAGAQQVAAAAMHSHAHGPVATASAGPGVHSHGTGTISGAGGSGSSTGSGPAGAVGALPTGPTSTVGSSAAASTATSGASAATRASGSAGADPISGPGASSGPGDPAGDTGGAPGDPGAAQPSDATSTDPATADSSAPSDPDPTTPDPSTSSAPAPDTTAPTIAWMTRPPATLATNAASATFSTDDPTATSYCQLDAAAATACAGTAGYGGLADGSHTLSVYAIDPAGNRSSTITAHVLIATAAPTLTGTPGSTVVLGTSATFTWTAVSGLSYQYRLNSGAWTAVSGNTQAVSVGVLGSDTFAVRGVDSQGNYTAVTSYAFTVIL